MSLADLNASGQSEICPLRVSVVDYTGDKDVVGLYPAAGIDCSRL